MNPSTIPQAFQHSVERHGQQVALMHAVSGEYVPLTYEELARRAHRFALGLIHLGIQPGDRIGVISENRPEWAVADLGMLSVGAVNTPVFPTLPPAQLQYVFNDSGARLVIVSDKKQLAKLLEIRETLPDLERLVVFDPSDPSDGRITHFDAVAPPADEEARLQGELDRRLAALQPDDLASVIYTSGTTGDPKGAMLTHGNFVSNAFAALGVVEVGPGDRFLSFLPLNHVFERLVGYYLPLFSGATIAYAESLMKLPKNMQQVKPTAMAAVPRLYETTAARVRQEALRGPESRQKAMAWALEVADKWARKVVGRQWPGVYLSLAHALADRLVYRKIRESFGGQVRLFVAAGAPLPPDVGYLFHGIGVTLIEGYGLTETSPIISVNRDYRSLKFGTVGPPVGGVEVRIAGDGEILVRGPNVMKGYWNKPEETAEAIDEAGWFHTGDIGHLDEDGYLVITDRKKNLLVLANGKKVAPAPIENKLKGSPLIAEVMLIGDQQDHVTALIVPDFDALRAAVPSEGAKLTNDELVLRKESQRAVEAEVKRLSGDLADFEKVRKLTLLPREFTVEGGELTPTLKLKRKVVLEKYAEQIAAMAG
jgi:long-chain acyl-CoA synthetase